MPHGIYRVCQLIKRRARPVKLPPTMVRQNNPSATNIRSATRIRNRGPWYAVHCSRGMPLLWGPIFKSLAIMIITGLSFSALLTLIVVPALYAVVFRIKIEEV